MVDSGRLSALEQEYASTAERVAALEARWQDLADQYRVWRETEPGPNELSIVEDREFPDAYAVLRAQYELDLELFDLVRSMREIEHKLAVLRSRPADDVSVIPAPVPLPLPLPLPRRERKRSAHVLRIVMISLGVVALLSASYALTRGSGDKPTVEVGVPAQSVAPITWKVGRPTVVKIAKKEGGGCLKTVHLAVGNGAKYADQIAVVRIEGTDVRVARDLRTRLDTKGRGTVGYETKRCAGSPVNSLRVLQVGDDVNVAAKRSR